MKVDIELTLDNNGNPCIKFKQHYDKDESLEQKVLSIFIKNARENGMSLYNPSGCGGEISFENYEIRPNVGVKKGVDTVGLEEELK